MRIVLAIMLALALAVLQADSSSADSCRYVFKTGHGFVDSCSGEHATNSTPRGAGPAILRSAPPTNYIGQTDPPADFCDFAPCIASFWDGKGFVVVCVDGKYSLSGGRIGACSLHLGVALTAPPPS